MLGNFPLASGTVFRPSVVNRGSPEFGIAFGAAFINFICLLSI